jgi:hypothetical protein
LTFLGGKILTKTRMQSPAGFNFIARNVGHDADEFYFIAGLAS